RSLEEFNNLLAAYIRKHNTTEHSTTGETPLSRYLHSGRPVRKPKSPEWLDECFLNRATRRVSRDATVELDSRCYDAPMQFIGQRSEEHTSELQSRFDLVCRLLLEKKK